jgi:putative hydrolase of the HAD superfamily
MEAYNRKSEQRLTGEAFLETVFDSLEFNRPLVDKLKKLAPIIIASDNYRENIEYISRRFHFDSWSIAQYYSFELQIFKSDVSFFQILLKDLDCTASDLLFIDDDPNNILTAESMGINGLIFKNNAQLFNELERYFI